ncbi:MAG: MlaD family protein [Bacteroidales bacterium]|jgi:phospholipid/cholesterol/gamma-HCH transport system substrate-binding protein|nr:MlaD family protein [Bacteroidales bacterium]
MKFKKEAKIAVIVTLIILLFFWGYNFLKGRNLFSSYNYYYATFEKVDGLQKSSSVTVNGFVIGLVSDIQFTSEKLDQIQVEIGVKKSFKIPKNSVVMIVGDLLGSKSIVLQLGDSPEFVKHEGTLPGAQAPDMIDAVTDKLMKTPIGQKLNKVLVSIDSVLMILQNTFDGQAQKNIQDIIANVEKLVSAERTKISMILTNFESVSGNLKKSNEDISQVIANLNRFSEALAASDVKNTVDNANRSLTQLNSLLSGISEGQGTLGKLAKDDSAYIYLQQSLNDLDKLLIDLRENPKDYVHFSLFGGKKSKK